MSSYNYRLKIQYKGTHYLGWQVQEGDAPTIQGCLNLAAQKVSKSNEIRTLGSGRTDSGVHALGQVCSLRMPLSIAPENLRKALNTNLPHDIRVIEVLDSNESFHPIKDALWKEYWYLFSNQEQAALNHELITSYSFDLDLEKMKEACKMFVGEHDFCNFFCKGTEVSSTIREIYECEIIQRSPSELFEAQFLPAYYCLRVRGNGFLKQMVRLIMGTLFAVGRNKVSLEQLSKALNEPQSDKLGAVAPASGLYLFQVHYPS